MGAEYGGAVLNARTAGVDPPLAEAVEAPARRGRSDRSIAAWTFLCLAVVGGLIASTWVGSGSLPAGTVWASLVAPESVDPAQLAVVQGLRLPRTVLAVVVGACLGLAGGLMQLHTGNLLADPGLLGVTSGAGLGVIVAIVFAGAASPSGYVWGAVAGAALAGGLVLGLASRVRSFDPVTSLIITGAVASSLMGAAATALVLLDEKTAKSFQGWAAGTLTDRPLSLLGVVAPLIVAGMVLVLVNVGSWRSATLGAEVSSALGRNVGRDRAVGAGAVVLLCAAATAVAGAIAFVGLLAPHLCRWLFGSHPVQSVLACVPAGAALVLVADAFGRIAVAQGELPVGVALALVGAPVFVFLARRSRA